MMNPVTPFQRHILPALIDPELQSKRDAIKITATAAQIIFGIKLAFSIVRTTLQAGSFITGGSILLLSFYACESILCHDLFRIATNTGFIFKSEIVDRYTHAYWNNVPQFLSSLFNQEVTDSIKILHSAKSFIDSVTENTVVVRYFNKEITTWLDQPK